MTNPFVKCAIAAFLLCVGASASASPAQNSPLGVWLFQNNRFAVEINPCGDRLCGKVSWLKAPTDAQGQIRVDKENPDPTLRARPVLGLTILSGFRRAPDGTWEDGEIYNPDDGSHYNASMTVSGTGALKVRAYVGVSLFGKTLSLTRMS